MDITNIQFRKIITGGKMKAIASVTLYDSFVVHDVKVVDGQNGLFVAMPSRRTSMGVFKDIAHPISQTARNIIQEKVLDAYFKALQEAEFAVQKVADAPVVEEAVMV
jgi:stage V sporulation protein G